MLSFDKMTVKAQEAVAKAQEIAAQHENQAIEPLHLLSALIHQQDGVVTPLLTRLGIRNEVLSQDLEREINRLPKVQGYGQQHMGRALNQVLERSFEEAKNFKD
jgi:ATP-dependent Clp protease ATP-binding subunit ClpB